MDYLVTAAVTLFIVPLTFYVLRSAMPPSPSAAVLKDAVLNFVKQGNLMARMRRKTKPGVPSHNFEHALGLCHETIEMDRLTVSKNALTYRYKLSNGQKLTPGLAGALMDETTAELMGSTGAVAGASLFFQVQWFPKKIKSAGDGDDYVDIVNTLTKQGKTIAHTRTDFVSSDQQVIGYSTHVKYLPTGSFMFDALLRYYPPWLSPWLSKLADSKLAEAPSTPAVTVGAHNIIDNHLKLMSDGKAEFTMQDEHNNPMGSLHGGCIAMIMEKVAEPYAKDLLQSSSPDAIHLESLQIQFVAGGRGRKTLKIACATIDVVENSHALVRVTLFKPKPEKKKDTSPTDDPKKNVASIVAQGVLKFVVE
jgi:acyl-coenzyme A thioesterase PaaI-like protein